MKRAFEITGYCTRPPNVRGDEWPRMTGCHARQRAGWGVTVIARVLMCIAAVLAPGCSSGPENELASEAIESVTLPAAPPVCDKSPAQLILFADYNSSTCSIDGGIPNECLPACGDGNAPCPAGAQCTGSPGLQHCVRADCTPNPAICSGETVCNSTTHRCELLSCSDDTTCPCGSYCDLSSRRCRLDCLTGVNSGNLGLPCNGTLTCDTRGRCGGTQIPAQQVVLAADPISIDLTPNSDGVLPPADVTIRLTTKDTGVGTQSPRPVRVAPPEGMQVACTTTDTLLSTPCMIAGWTYTLQSGIYTASRVIRVAVLSTSHANHWSLELATDDQAQHIVVEADRHLLQQRAGRYRGTLALGGGTPVSSLPIEATVTDTMIALHDPSRVIDPTGDAVLPITGQEQTTSFLGGRKQASLYQKDAVYFSFHPASLTFDPATGKLTGDLGVRLGTSPDQSEVWSFELTRTADLTTAAPCPTAEVIDPAIGACVPGEPWDPAPALAPAITHAVATKWLDAMAPRLDDSLLAANGVEPLAEHLLCFDASSVALDGNGNPTASTLLKTTLPVSGDLACAGATVHNWWGVGLVGYQDRGQVAPALTQADMLAQCVQQLTEPAPIAVLANNGVPAIANNSCVSLARFLPSLFAVAGTAPYRLGGVAGGSAADRRSRLLFLRLLAQWTQLTGFVARNGAEQRGVADLLKQLSVADITDTEKHVRDATQAVTFGSLLDVVDSGWTLVLDKRIHEPLLAIGGAALASPDYRTFQRPLAYWTFGDRAGTTVNDAIGGAHNLSAPGCVFNGSWLVGSAACAPQTNLSGVGQNVTVAFKLVPNLAAGTTSTVIDSDALFVRLVLPAVPGTPWLEVGEALASGAFETRTIPLSGGFNTSIVNFFVLVRNLPRGGWSVSYGPVGRAVTITSTSVRYGHVGATGIPAVASDVVRVGASRTSAAQNLNGQLSEVAIWDSALSQTEAEALIMAYSSGSLKPAWPTEVTVPPPTDPDANEAAVGLPALLLESLIGTQELIEAYVKDGMLADVVSCRSGHLDDGLQRLKDRAARSLRLSYAVEELAAMLEARAVQAGPIAWADRYDQALTELAAARAKVLQALTAAGTCEDPFGLGPTEFPLYFGDTRSLFDSGRPLDLLEASAQFLKGQAGSGGAAASGAIGDAVAALADARSAWTAQYSSAVQEQLTNNSTERLDDIRSSYGRELIDLCGVPVGGNEEASTVLGRFLNVDDPAGHLTPQDCFIQKETVACTGSENQPLGQVDPACFRGQVGESWLAAQSASARVVRAQLARQAARDVHSRWLSHCAQKQGQLTLSGTILDELADFETTESTVSSIFGAARGVAELVTGYVSSNPALALAGAGDTGRSLLDLGRGTAERKAALEKLAQAVIREGELQDCWAQADLAGIPVAGAEQDVVVAMSDLQTALAHTATIHNRLIASVREAAAAIARETGRLRPRIAFHYWAQEKLEIFQRRMARARRMTYLYLRAVEHDLQRNFGLDDDVIGASHPEQLNQVALQLGGFLANGIEKRVPSRKHVVVSLCNDVLRLPEHNDEIDCDQPKSTQRFRELLFSPANAMYKDDGTYLGQAIPFTLTPELAGRGHPAVFSRCVERLAEVDVNFVNDSLTLMPVLLAKRETFYSETCADHVGEIGAIQQGTLRSSNNLLVEGPAAHFGRDFEWARADINALKFDRTVLVDRDPPGTNAVRDLGGRGLYGDYALIVPPGTLSDLVANPGTLRDLQVRFDYVSVADQGVAPPATTHDVTIEYLDGNDQPLVDLGGNAVSATCTSGCAPDAVSTLTAAPAAGWHFGGWTGACAGASTTCSVPTASTRRVWATFVDDRAFDLTLASAGTGWGAVTTGWLGAGTGAPWTIPSPNLPLPQHLPANAPVSVTASPAAGSTFTGWSGGVCSGTANPCIIPNASATGAATVTAAFVPNPVPPMLTINRTGAWETWSHGHGFCRSLVWSGSSTNGQEIPCEDYVCKVPFSAGTVVSVGSLSEVRTSEECYFQTTLGPDCATGSGPPAGCNILMNTDRSVTLLHRYPSYLDVTRPSHGRISSAGSNLNCGSPDSGAPQNDNACHLGLPVGSFVTVSVTPAPGFQFLRWTGDAGTCGSSTSCVISLHVASGHLTISALFNTPPPPPVCTPGTTRACCTCPPGRCSDPGEQTCSSSGQWGGCVGSTCGTRLLTGDAPDDGSSGVPSLSLSPPLSSQP